MLKTFTYLLWASFVLSCFPNTAYGQKNFVPGYLILPSRDTISGLVDDQNWDRNPTAVNFRKSKEAETERYTARQIAGFGILQGDTYRQSSVQIDKTPVRFEELLADSRPVLILDTVFLLELVRGEVSLYHLLDENHKSHFFIQKEDGPLAELIQRNYVTYKNNQALLGTANQYKDQLKYSYLMECTALQPRIAKTAYDKAALSALIQEHNVCLNPAAPVKAQAMGEHVRKFGLVGGLNFVNYKFTSAGYKYLTKTVFDWQRNPMVGISFQLLLPRSRHKWSIYNELTWKQHHTQGHFITDDSYYTGRGTITIKANYIGLTSLLRYTWMNQNYQPFFNAGLAANAASTITTHLWGHEQYRTYERTFERDILENPSKFEGAIVAGAGIKRKKMAAEIRAERGYGYLNPYVEISTRKMMLAFLLSYQLN